MSSRQAAANWQPAASVKALRARARLLGQLREWFAEEQVLEVETPQLSVSANTDPHIESYAVETLDATRYLRTSVEFHHKRLLAAGVGDIYEIGKVFRAAEQGRHHNPEFTMLEWYRLGMDHHQLIDSIEQLLVRLHDGEFPGLQRLSYRDCLRRYVDLDPATAGQHDVIAALQAAKVSPPDSIRQDIDALLDLLIGTVLAQRLPADQYTCIFDYPASQASLARIDRSDPAWPVASRFEIYFGALELANGFHELDDASEQLQRFQSENQARLQIGAMAMPIDNRLIAALEAGLPACAGVAIGLDRLLLALQPGLTSLADVLSFDWRRA